MEFLFGWFFKKYRVDEDIELKSFFKKWFLISLGIILVTSIFSSGFHHFDEHWQILEFLNLKLGNIDKAVLPWEYQYQMRSFTQPLLYFIVTKVLFLDDPFIMAFVFRFITALIGWYAGCLLCLSSIYLYKDKKSIRWATILLSLCWYIPYLKVRPSSEGLSSTVFVIGLVLLVTEVFSKKDQPKSLMALFMAGLVCGFSFLFRFQLGFMILFLWFWMVFFSGIKFWRGFLFAIGVCVAVVIEIPIDRWGYGEWTFVPWNYLYQNLVLDKASNFPTSPWWDYFKSSTLRGIPPLSLLLISAQCLFWFKNPKSLFTWATFPLLLIHSLIAAKAIRYMFPIVIFTPMFLPWVHNYLLERAIFYKKLIGTKWGKGLGIFFLGINMILLTQLSLRSAKKAVGFYKEVYQSGISKIYYEGENPFTMLGLELNFYKKKNLEMKKISDFEEIQEKGIYLFSRKGKEIELNRKRGCEMKYLTYPEWLLSFNVGNWVGRSRVWSLWYCP